MTRVSKYVDVSSSALEGSARSVLLSSLCVSAAVLILGGFDIVEVDVQDREQVDSGEKEEARERERKKTKREQTTHAQTCDIMDDMRWSECAPKTPLSQNVVCAQSDSVGEKLSCEKVSVYTSRRLQWIVIDCKRNQL